MDLHLHHPAIPGGHGVGRSRDREASARGGAAGELPAVAGALAPVLDHRLVHHRPVQHLRGGVHVGVAGRGAHLVQVVGDADLGLDQRYVYGVLRQIRQESGGNPNAVNNNDSNWANGYASFGLIQTIAPTYQSFAPPGQRGNITWVTVNGRAQRFVPEMVVPYNNIYAGLNYAKTRYGVARFEAWNRGQNYAY